MAIGGRFPLKSRTLQDDPRSNHLLRALPAEDWARVQPGLEPMELKLGMSVYESGDRTTCCSRRRRSCRCCT